MKFRKSGTFLSILLGILMLTACIRSESPKDLDDATAKSQKIGFEEAEQSAAFYIAGDAQGPVVEIISSVDGDTKEVTGLKYRFEVCIEEKATQRTLQGFPFIIESPQGEVPKFSTVKSTDEAGCLVWSEDFMFDVGKPNPQPSIFLRKIRATEKSSINGEVSFVFQLYPWEKVFDAQPHPAFYYLRGEERSLYKSSIQKLFSGEYNPHNRLKYEKAEKTRLLVTKLDYDLTAIPFSVIKKDLQPSREEIEREGIKALRRDQNYVMNPELSNPQYDSLLAKYLSNPNNRNISPYKSLEEIKAFDGLKVDLVLRINLSLPYASVNGIRRRDQLSGRFSVLPYIYSSDYDAKGERVLLNPEMGALEANVSEKGIINLIYPGILPYTPTSGRVEIALRIVPLDDNITKYEPIEEIFTIGNYDQMIGSRSNLKESPLQFRERFNFIEYAKGSVGFEEMQSQSHLRKAEPFNFSLASVRHKTIEAGETATRRTVIFNVNTCVTNVNLFSRTLEGQEFEVFARHFKNPQAEKEDELATSEKRDPVFVEGDYKDVKLFAENDGDRLLTDSKGCLNFIDKINHKYYQTERLIRRKYFLKAKNDVQNFTKELVLYLNPWDEKFGTLGTDARSVSQTFLKELNSRKKIVPRFFIKDYRYETLRFRYEIDENMNLIVKKTVLFRTLPWVMRYSNILQGINSVFSIRDGIYLLKMAYQKDYLDPAAKGVKIRSGVTRMEPGGPSVKTTEELITYTNERGEVRTSSVAAKEKAMMERSGYNIDGSHEVIPPYSPGRRTALSIVKKLVRVNAGSIVTPIEFSVDDLRLLRIRAQLFVQIEPINQTRLQIVNKASREIEKAINLKKGKPSDIAKLPKDEQREIVQKKMHALDTLAEAIPDNLEYSKKDASELIRVFKNPKVIQAFSPFIPGGELSSVAKMLGKEASDKDLMMDSVSQAFDKEEEFIAKLKEETNTLKMQNKRFQNNIDVRSNTIVSDKGEDIEEFFYENPESFYAMCGEGWNGYEQCVEENKKKDPDFNELYCKCFDNISSKYKPFSTKNGDHVAFLQEQIENLKKRKELMSSASILKEVRENSKKFFSSLSNDSALEELLLNDFTMAQAEADISDLDLLKDKVVEGVDIEKRTFVGPLTFLNNSNGGALRPTDNLDEAYCVTDDCNSLATDPLDKYSTIQNFDYERSPYHGSIAHFSGVHVDDLINGSSITIGGEVKKIPSYQNFKEQKAKEYKVKSLLSNFVEDQNLNYVSLRDKKLKKFVCENPMQVNFETGKCLENYNQKHIQKADLFEVFNKYSSRSHKYKIFMRNKNKGEAKNLFRGLDPVFDENFLKEVVVKDHGGEQCTKKIVPSSYASFSKNEYAKFCSLMTFGLFNKVYSELEEGFLERAEKGEIDYSISSGPNIINKGLTIGFDKHGSALKINSTVEQLYASCLVLAAKGEFNEPLDIERKYRIEETGKYYYLGGKSMNINLGQTIGISHKNDSNKVHKMDIGAITSYLPNFLKGYGYSYSKGAGISASESLNIMQGTFLVMQNAEFDVQLKKYEQCLVIRWSDSFLKFRKNIFYYSLMHEYAKDTDIMVNGEPYSDYITRKLTEGLMVCSGDVEDKPVAIRETYYYFTQHFTEGDMQDRADIHNHPWLLSLRGVREFETFLAYTLSDHDVADQTPESRFVHAEELVGMNKLLESDLAGENLDGSSYENFDKFKRNSWPLRQLVRTYRKISPTFPGLFTQLNRREYQVSQWPWVNSEPGEKFDKISDGEKQGLSCYQD